VWIRSVSKRQGENVAGNGSVEALSPIASNTLGLRPRNGSPKQPHRECEEVIKRNFLNV